MKHLYKFLFFSIIINSASIISVAQINLVPNFSFEQYDTCPNSQDQIQYAIGWSTYSDVFSTPDYYNSCSSGFFNVPNGAGGYQMAHRNCSAYAGLVTWGSSGNDREHIGIQLNQPLIIGQKYFVSFYTVMGEVILGGNHYGMPSNGIGMRFSSVSYNPGTPCPIDNFAHLYSPTIINDSINWIRISGSIIADSAYQYLILGNFFDDANTDTMQYSCGSCFNSESYYFIEDICVSTDSLLCNGGIDVLSCAVFVLDTISNEKVSVFPNPAYNFITVLSQNNFRAEILLCDVFGKVVYSEKVNSANNLKINLSSFSSGIYVLKIVDESEKISICKKIIKL